MRRTQLGELPREPFAWMGSDNTTGPYRVSLKSPRSGALFGGMFLTGSAFVGALVLQDPTPGAIIAGTVVTVIFAGLGIFLLVMAVARRRWIVACRRASSQWAIGLV
ncbi:hypothetical protein KPL76_03910 [Subtercola sp. PAMC28395]|uniref:hypothetical protein n=1 Tax=Subtercola sp. PAMC28395 TaxID=2846775 RepID=UPI001C0D5A9C|nr:hypothetical protein [Subtercola sp. PAMC28395]QWT24545.1 hypothetical protein KPL76_03910 [Subtercola sp. PAMC28395]